MNAVEQLGSDELQSAARGKLTWRVVGGGLAVLLIWAALADIDEVTRAQAQVIASARTQVIQAVEQGVVTGLQVQEGDIVKAGQSLVTLERARAEAAVDDSSAKVAALRITLLRLKAEVYGTPLVFDQELLSYAEYISNQKALYERRRTAFQEDIASVLGVLKLARQELAMNESLVTTGDVSRAEVLRMHRQVADLEAQMANKKNKYFQDAQAEMTKVQEDLNTQMEMLRDRQQVLEHTELTAPKAGIVKNIKLTTLGAVVRPGDVVMEILPTDGRLVVEAKVSTGDIAFVHVGQSANVKLDAYDYSIFGSLKGEVTYVSPDTLVEETKQGPMAFYRVHVSIPPANGGIRVLPGMTATAEIKSRDRSVLSYLVKPLRKTLSQSMGER